MEATEICLLFVISSGWSLSQVILERHSQKSNYFLNYLDGIGTILLL